MELVELTIVSDSKIQICILILRRSALSRGIPFPAPPCPSLMKTLLCWFFLWPMCTLTGIARRGATATWRRRRRRRNEQSWMKNIQERVFPLVRQLKGFVCADGVKIDNRGGGELGLGGCWLLMLVMGAKVVLVIGWVCLIRGQSSHWLEFSYVCQP